MNKIIYISTAYLPSQTAQSVHIMKMASAVSSNGIPIKLYALKKHRSLKNNSIDLHDFYGVKNNFIIKLLYYPYPKFVSAYSSLRSLFDVLMCEKRNKIIIYSRNIIISYLFTVFHYNTIYEVHDFYPSFLRIYIEPLIVKSKRLIKVVVISNALQIDFINKYTGFRNIEVHHDAANQLPPNKNSRMINADKARKQFGYVGSLYEGRGIEIVIAISRKLPTHDFIIIGGSKEEINHFNNQGVPKNIKFEGYVNQKKLARFYNGFDILLMPYQKKLKTSNTGIDTSRWMSPMKLFEYMSSKKPIISSDLSPIREVLDDSMAIIVNPSSVYEWVGAAEMIIKNSQLAKKLSYNAYTKFINNYTWDKRSRKIFQFMLK